MKNFKFVILFFICTGTYCCSESQEELINPVSSNSSNVSDSTKTDNNSDDLSNTDFNILFIGNSLTYTNNLPELVQERAKLKGIIIGIKTIALPNYAIIDHWNDGDTQTEIASKQFDFVIIQQGPSSQPFGREILIEYGEKYSNLCIDNDAQLCFFMVWPALTNYHTFAGVIDNYRDAAAINSAILLPVGAVWKEHFDSTNNFDYYGQDGFHPSLKGSEVAADIIFESLF